MRPLPPPPRFPPSATVPSSQACEMVNGGFSLHLFLGPVYHTRLTRRREPREIEGEETAGRPTLPLWTASHFLDAVWRGGRGRRGQPGGKTHFPQAGSTGCMLQMCLHVRCQRRDRGFHTISGSNPLLRPKPLKKEQRKEFAAAFFWIPDHRKPSILCKQTLHGHRAITLLIHA